MTIQAASVPAARPAVEDAASSLSAVAELCVVVPLRNDGGNVWPLVFALRSALGPMSMEVLFVDDSDDNTPEMVRGVAELMNDGRSDFRVRVLHREPERRLGGRVGAVEEGLAHSEATYLVVMDSDLRHPPALVPVLLDRLRCGADVVIPGHRAEQDLEALPDFFGISREALTAPTLNVVELPF
jgi:dolichol-phosphate mannosyltransferase